MQPDLVVKLLLYHLFCYLAGEFEAGNSDNAVSVGNSVV